MAKPKKPKPKKKLPKKAKKRKVEKKKKKRKKVYKPPLSKYFPPKISIEPPEGYELLEAVTESATEARARIHRLLQRVCNTIDISCWFRTWPYEKAGEADGWLIVSGVKGVDTSSIVQSIQEIMLPDVQPDHEDYNLSALGRGYWITVGFRWQGTGDEEEEDQYKKYHGMIEVSSNYRPMSNRARILSAFSVGQLPSSRNPNSMITNIEKKFNRTIGEIFVKIVWNSRNAQPARSIPEEE